MLLEPFIYVLIPHFSGVLAGQLHSNRRHQLLGQQVVLAVLWAQDALSKQ